MVAGVLGPQLATYWHQGHKNHTRRRLKDGESGPLIRLEVAVNAETRQAVIGGVKKVKF